MFARLGRRLKRLVCIASIASPLALVGISCVGSDHAPSDEVGVRASTLTASEAGVDEAETDEGAEPAEAVTGVTLPVDIMGPETVTSASHRPQERVFTFDLPPGISGPFTLVVENGDADQPHRRGKRHWRSHRGHASSRVATAKVWLNGDLVLGSRDINKARASASAKGLAIAETNELSVRYVGRPGSFLRLRVVAEGCAPSADECSDIRICYFDERDAPHIIEVERSAFTAHLEHGDGLAPDSVQTDADCLVPQPPPEPVSAVATTGEDGVARFVIPGTNIRVVAAVTDENGVSLPSVNLTLLTAGGDYLLIGQDLSEAPSYAPAFVEGSLLDARPGSAPTVAANIVMQVFNSTFPGGGLLDPGGTIPEFVVNQFVSTSDACFTEEEFRRLLSLFCQGGIRGTVSILAGVTGAPKLVSFVLPGAASLTLCPSLAANGAANTFQGLSFPLRIRQYEPPFLPGVPVPVYFEALSPCGGACCGTTNTNDCSNTSAAGSCATGVYSEGTYCSADPCECPTGTVECAGGICVADTCGGGASMNPATCMCDCGPSMVDCQGVCTSYQCSGGKVLSPTSCLCECLPGTTECNGQCGIDECDGDRGFVLDPSSCSCECAPGMANRFTNCPDGGEWLPTNTWPPAADCVQIGGSAGAGICPDWNGSTGTFLCGPNVKCDQFNTCSGGVLCSTQGCSHCRTADTSHDANVAIHAEFWPDPVPVGELANFRLYVTNDGPAEARDVVLTIRFPTELASNPVFYELPPSDFLQPCSLSGEQVVCDIGELPSSTQATIEGSATTSVPGLFTGTMVVTSAANDPKPDNNSTNAIWDVR